MKTLGKFQKVDLRDYWEDEAKEFTPWLSKDENIEILSEAIGIDIEIEGKEVSVGNYKADLVGRDILNNKKIIIENQLEKTNHDHLGKIITYASGIEASIIIWICKTITEEHRQAIDWLNENMDDNIGFFAIEIELWKIDGSNPAPKFNIICRPVEKDMGVVLNWQELPDGQDSRIILYSNGNIKDKSQWDEISEWFKKYAELFYKAFNERVKKLKL